MHGTLWMVLLWTCDTCPSLTHSPSSRWPITVIPSYRYHHENEVNITLQAITQAISKSFNDLSTLGIPICDLPSMGGGEAPWKTWNVFIHVGWFYLLCAGFGGAQVVYRIACLLASMLSEVCRLWLYVVGFRADWKALVALFNLTRHPSTNEARLFWVKGGKTWATCVKECGPACWVYGSERCVIFDSVPRRYVGYAARLKELMMT